VHLVHLFSPEDSENSGSFADKGKGSQRRTCSCVIKRSISKAVAAPSQDDSIDDFVIPPPHAKKHTTPKASTRVVAKNVL
jgi:hypothetical protein